MTATTSQIVSGVTGLTDSQVAAVTAGGASLVGVLIDGDSLGAQNWNEIAVISLTRSGTTATVTGTGLAVVPGSRLKIGNVTNDPAWNGFWTCLAGGSSTATFTVPATLAATATTTRSQMTVASDAQRTASGDYVWAEMVNGVNYTLVDNVAIGGRVLTEMLADFDTVGPGLYTGCLIDFCGGTNDPKHAVATATSAAALEAYIVKALARGHRVLINTVPPLAGAANTAAVQIATLALNKEYKRLALQYRQPLFDKYAALVDPAAAAMKATYFDSSDNIHLTPTGAKVCGAAKAAIYAAHVPTRPINSPGTTSDTVGAISGSANIMDGFFAGTGGSGGAGSVATGWTLAPTTITVTGSKGSGTVGATQILTLSGASGSFTFTGTSVHASLVAGSTYEMVGKVSLANFAAGLRATIGLLMNVDAVASLEIRSIGTRNATTPLPTGAVSFTFRSEPFTIPSGATVSSCLPRFTGVTTGVPGGTETVTLENFALQRVR